ncbi:MAG: sulfotransferase domain-containing protein [Caldilineaceae bacterium]
MQPLTRFYFGHHKCASQYIKTIMRQSAILMGWSVKVDGIATLLPMDYHVRQPFADRILAKQEVLAKSAYDLICLENADNDALEIIEKNRSYRGFHVIRDPRDIVVSGYFSHRYSHPVSEHESPWLWRYRALLDSLPDQERGFLAEIDFCSTYFDRLRAWNYQNPQILEIRYETLIAKPTETFAKIFRFLNVSVPVAALRPLVQFPLNVLSYKLGKQPLLKGAIMPVPLLQWLIQRHAFERKSGGRTPGAEDLKHHYRKGIAGDWRNYFTPPVKDAFKKRYPGLVESLGYEANEDW